MDISNKDWADVLVQALPYFKQYTGKTVVVKYGGNAMLNEDLKAAVMQDIVLLNTIGVHVVLVHGGGPEINALLEKIGKEPPLTLWKQRMERMLGSGYCIGEITYYSRPEKHSILSWMKAAPITVSDHHKPIISKELYAAARERRQKERSKGNLTPEH